MPEFPHTSDSDAGAARGRDADLSVLTPRQREVLDLLLEGLSEKEIATRLVLSRHTVHNHIRGIYRSMGVSSRYELFAKCTAIGDDAGAAGSMSTDALLAALPEVVLQTRKDGVVEYINRTGEGVRRADVVGKAIFDWVAPDDRDALRRDWTAIVGGKGAHQRTFGALGDHGAYRKFEAVIQPAQDGVVVSCRELNDAGGGTRNNAAFARPAALHAAGQ